MAIKRKKGKKTIIKDRCFNIWSLCVRAKANNRCEICGQVGTISHPLHAHHLISRKFLETAFDVDNGVCLCANHHMFSDVIAPHSDNIQGIKKFLAWLELSSHAKYIDRTVASHGTYYESELLDIEQSLIEKLATLLKLELPATRKFVISEFNKKYYY